MKICGISDLHGNLINNIPNCDVLCIAGDIIPIRIQRDYKASEEWWLNNFCNWVKELPCKKVIFTAGNHDFFLEELYTNCEGDYYAFIAKLEQNSNDKAILLINEAYSFLGLNFYGFPYIRPIPFQSWAFTDNYEGVSKPSIYNSLIDKEIDILITHDSPMKNHCLDDSIERMYYKPKAYFYGHWHNGISDSLQGMYNCSILDDYYNKKENFEIPTVEMETRESTIEEIFNVMIDNVPMYTALKGYDNFQVNAIKEYLKLNKEFFLKQKEDEIPLPVTGEVIEEEHEEDDN